MSLLMVRALLFAGECLAASLVLPLLAFAIARFARRAALRHLVWTTMFGVLAVLPLAALLLPPRLIALPAPQPVVLPVDVSVAYVAAGPEPWLTLENGVLLLAAFWALGLCWHLARMALGMIGLMRLRRESEVFTHDGAACELRLSDRTSGPSTFGLFQPVVMLPAEARGWSAQRLAAVLAHETAHVRRRDTAAQGLARLVCAFYWINPLVWLAARALRREAEIAADDQVLAAGMTPSVYAETLLQLATEARGRVPGIAMAESALAARVQSVLAANTTRKGVSRMDFAKTLSLGLAATLLLGTARFDLALAQNVAPAPNVEMPVPPLAPVETRSDVQMQRRIDAEAAGIRARAGQTAARARARAESEPDPVKREQYRQDAARVAADAARLQANAGRMSAQARQHLEDARQRAEAARVDMQDARQRMAQARQRLAEDQFGLNAEWRALMQAQGISSQDDEISRRRTISREVSSTRDGVQIDIRVAPLVTEVINQPEVRAAINEAVRTAVAEARSKVSAAVAEARAKAGLPPTAPVPPAP